MLIFVFRSFKLKVVLTKPKQTYVFAVKKLPEPINVDKVCYKVNVIEISLINE